MKTIYFTITGLNYRYGDDFLEKGTIVTLEKEPKNEIDPEAIQVKMPGLGRIGYVASNYRTMLGESYSAGRIYDQFDQQAKGEVLYKLDKGVLCILKLEEEIMVDETN